jgi:hypothetical protein
LSFARLVKRDLVNQSWHSVLFVTATSLLAQLSRAQLEGKLDAHPGGNAADEEVVLATECDPARRSLGRVVIERHACVVKKAAELAPLVQHVAVGSRDRALRWMAWPLLEQPRVQLVANRSSPLSSEPEMSFRADDLLRLRVVLDPIEAEDQSIAS